MTEEEFRKHCERQIERSIKFQDSKHLKEHQLSLALLNENEERKKDKENLIKYLEDMISIRESYLGTDNANFDTALEDEIDIIKDILEKVKSGKYE